MAAEPGDSLTRDTPDGAGLLRNRFLPLVPILVLAAGLRLWGLGAPAVVMFDSGGYLNEGWFLASAAQRAASALVAPGPGAPGNPLARVVQALENGTEAHPPEIAKPGNAVLFGLSMLALGKSLTAGVLVSALAGIGTVAATYAVGLAGWGRRIAIPAALLLAVSAEHLFYSREPLVESSGMFFALLGALIYLRAVRGDAPPRRLRPLFWAGVVFGLAFTCNNRLSYLPAMLAPVEVALWRAAPPLTDRWRLFGRRVLYLAAGFLAPLLAVEAAYLVVRRVGRLMGAVTPWLDYLEQLRAFGQMNAPRLRFDQLPTFWVDLALMEGVPYALLLVAGLIAAVRARGRADWLLLGSLVVPLALYSVYSTGEVRMRHFSLALPWVALAAALGAWALAATLAALARRFRVLLPAAPLVVAFVLVSAAVMLPRSLEIATAPSAWPELLAYTRSAGIQRVSGTTGPVLGFLLGEENANSRFARSFVQEFSDLRLLVREGYRYFVLDMQNYAIRCAAAERSSGCDFDARLGNAVPLLSRPNGNGSIYLADMLEHRGMGWGDWGPLLQEWQANRANATSLRLFAIADLVPIEE